MGLGDLFKKKQVVNPPNEHRSLLVERAKMLIEELVSPLDQPNQQVIDELLTIIQQTTSMPSHLVNKEQVLKTTKGLLYQLIKPIPNPNKKLIHELLLILTNPEQALQKPEIEAGEEQKEQASPSSEASAAQAENKEQQENAQQQKPQQPAKTPSLSEEELKKQKTVMNLILQQIKELITITNNLNGKIKSFEPRVEAMEKIVGEIKEKNENFEKKLSDFERNMEKFIGLYEVVTNQFNPFVDTGQDIDDFTQDENPSVVSPNNFDERLAALEQANNALQEQAPQQPETTDHAQASGQMQQPSSSLQTSPVSTSQPMQQNPTSMAQPSPQSQPKELILKGITITSVQQLEDALLNLSDEEFLQSRDAILQWLQQQAPKFYELLKDKQIRKEFTKAIMVNL